MSFRGIIAILLEAGLIIMVMGTEIKEFLISAVCLGGLLVLSFFSVLWAMLFLRFSTFFKHSSCEREQSIKFTLKIRGILLLPVVLQTALRTPFKERRKATVPIYSNIVLDILKLNRCFDFMINCPHSGNWSVGIKRIKVCDIFGFFKTPLLFTAVQNCTDRVTVTPKFYWQENSKDTAGAVDNYSGLAFGNSELGEVFEDNRTYRQGDPLRRINWKQSAKIGKPITRLYEKPKKSRVVIALDYYTLEDRGRCDDIYRETALFIAEYFAGQKNDVTVCLLRPENLGVEFTCSDITDLSNLALDLADICFKRDVSGLTDIPLNDFDFYDRDRIFIITSNPHNSVITASEIMNSQDLYVAVITPKTAALTELAESPYITVLNSSDEISQKVGAVLC